MELQEFIFITKEHEQAKKATAVGFAPTNNIKLAAEHYSLTNTQYCWAENHAKIYKHDFNI